MAKKYDPIETMESIEQVTEMLAGTRNALVAQGFSAEVAERLVLEMYAHALRSARQEE